MRRVILWNRLKWYVPTIVALIALSVLLGAIAGVDSIRRLTEPTVDLDNAKFERGEFVELKRFRVIGTYAVYGENPEETQEEYFTYRYVVALSVSESGKETYIGARLSRSAQKYLLEIGENEVTAAGVSGTLLESPPGNLDMLRAWLLEEEALVDLDEATLAAITPNLVLYVGYRGRFPYAIAIALTLIFLFSGVAAAGFAAGLARLLLTRRYRGYTDPQTFGSALILTSDKVLLTRAFGERELNRSELSRVFPRTKRMEGGRLRWSIVFMVGATGKREFIAWLDSESQVQEVLAKFNADE